MLSSVLHNSREITSVFTNGINEASSTEAKQDREFADTRDG